MLRTPAWARRPANPEAGWRLQAAVRQLLQQRALLQLLQQRAL